MRAAFFFAVLLVMAPFDWAPAHAQQSASPPAPASPSGGAAGETSPRTRPELSQKGTGVIRGRVVRSDTGQPLRRAIVRALSEESRSVATDDEGRYEFAQLPEGRYSLTASKGGFGEVNYGQRRSYRGGRAIALAAGQVVGRIDFALPPGGVIAGRVVDETGEPAVGGHVTVSRLAFSRGRREPVQVAGAQVDDRGEFRVFGLRPGEYYLTATFTVSHDLSGTSVGYVPTYFPGTPVRGDAQRIAIKPGEEISGVTFALARARTASVSGIVRNADGSSAANTMVTAREVSGDSMFGREGGAALAKPDGSFSIGNLAPGSYVIEARGIDRPDTSPARADVVVNGRDVSGVDLEITKGATARGRIRFDTGAPPPGLRPEQVRIFSAPDDQGEPTFFSPPPAARADWTFELAGISGRRLLQAAVFTGDWLTKSVVLDGADATDTPIDFRADVDGIEIVLTQKVPEVSGRVTDASGRAVVDAVVIVFADDPEKRGRSRYLMTARPDQDGRYRVRGLRPAHYLAVAIEDIEEGEESNPELLEQLTPRATRLGLGDAESRTLDLTLTVF
jgi:hypothetical protein